MSYLGSGLNPFENLLSRHRKVTGNQHKRLICQRVNRIHECLSTKDLFQISIHQLVPLKNTFTSNPKELDTRTIHDLNFSIIGMERMLKYVKEHILPLPEGESRPRKKRLQKLSTFSKTVAPAREQKRRVNELENIATNAMQILQERGITAQTSPYPLAIADIHGQGKQSEFVNVMKGYFPNAFTAQCPPT